MSKTIAKTKSADPTEAGSRRSVRLDREAWVAAARRTLVDSGVARVKVELIAGQLGVTTGSFYWHFKDRQALLDAVLEDWESTSSRPLFDAVAAAGDDPNAQFDSLVRVWVEENDYSPAYDSAVRDWARTSEIVDAAVRRADDRRIELLRQIFARLGNPAPDDLVRARITYFHQVGYYAMHIHETRAQRLSLLPVYIALLKGELRERGSTD